MKGLIYSKPKRFEKLEMNDADMVSCNAFNMSFDSRATSTKNAMDG